MAENQKNVKALAQQKATTIDDLYSDCLLSILAFIHPLEIWFQRLTCSRWHEVVPVALSRVIQIHSFRNSGCSDMICSEQEKSSSGEVDYSRYTRQVADLCPNLKTILFVVDDMVQKCSIYMILITKKRFICNT